MNWNNLSNLVVDSCIGAFSENVTILLSSKVENESGISQVFNPFECKGVFDATYKQVDLQAGAIVSSKEPRIEFSIRSLPRALTKEDKIIARGVEYRISEIQPDSDGSIIVLLSRYKGR